MATERVVPVVAEQNRMHEFVDRIHEAQAAIRHAQQDMRDAQRKLVVELARRGNFDALKPDMSIVRHLVQQERERA